ncbi:MAG: hypothetical protein ABR998_01585 [Gemmatimonadales bacterium]|jgi:outer membrane murein-binding lipoprotein Lpp
MCRTVVSALALAGILAGPCVEAQGVRAGAARVRTLAARAESLEVQIAKQDSLAKQRRYDDLRARRFTAGDVTVLVPGVIGEATGQHIADGAKRYLDTLGAVPPGFVASLVTVAYLSAGWDSVLQVDGLAARTRIMVDIPANPDSLADGWGVAARIVRAYVETLDPSWRSWAPLDLGLGFMKGRDDVAAVRELAAGDTRAGTECLGGRAAACRSWLGFDREASPYTARYTAAEIRNIVSHRMVEYLNASAQQCVRGSDDACLRYAQTGGVAPVPAGLASVRSVLRAIRVLHGAEALRRALADTSGAIGDRLARAAGIGEDSLVTEWRAWLLTGGGRPRVSASARDAMPVLLFGGLLLFAAARSGRWR